MVRLYRLFEMPLAMSPGVVSHAMPLWRRVSRRSRYGFWGAGWACGAAYSLMLPSGIVIEMGSRGFFAMSSSYFFLSRSKLRQANS